jgi:hypothetical protein
MIEEISLRPFSPRPVMASTVTSDVMAVPELVMMKALLPSITHSAFPWPSSSLAVVRMPPGMSDPPPGSVRPKAASRSPVHSSGSHRSRCPAVPNR